MEKKYNRVLLKLSGESLAGDEKKGINFDIVETFCKSIKKCVDAGVQVAIVVGGGNFWRGRSSRQDGQNKSRPYGYVSYNYQCFRCWRHT